MKKINIAAKIRDIPNFPKQGIIFKDITPLLADPEYFEETINLLLKKVKKYKVDMVAGIESRGFIFGPVLAQKLKVGFIPIRKEGKLPFKKMKESYSLEYGTATIEIHKDAIKKGQKVLIIDDLIATGGTARAAVKLIEKLGGKISALAFVTELEFLNGRKLLQNYHVVSLIKYKK